MSIIKPRTARVVIYHGDDLVRLSDLDNAVLVALAELRQAERTKSAEGAVRLMSEPDEHAATVMAASERVDSAKAERDEFATEAEGRGVTVVLHSLPRKDWRRLRNAHPPREGNAEDQELDCNVDSLPDEVLAPSINLTESTIEGDLDQFLDSLNSHDYYQRLFVTVLALNVGGAMADPKARLLSPSSPTSSAT